MTQSPRRSERGYYDSFFTGSEGEELDDGVGFQSLRRAQASYLRQRIDPVAAKGTILSVGCGNGEIEMHLADPHWHVVAFDLSFVGPATGRQRAAQRDLGRLSFGQASLTELPLSACSCDVVIAMSVLHHIQPLKRAAALCEVHRVLKEGGWFLAYDPSKWRVLRLAKFLVRAKYDAVHSPDEEELSPRQMQRLAQKAGFEPVRVEFFDMFIDPLTWLFPDMSPTLFKLLYGFDRALVRFPGKQLASNFFLIGHKLSSAGGSSDSARLE